MVGLLKGQDLVFPFHRLSVAQGLTSQSYNHYIFKDSRGFVWVSSMSGLNRFDGREVRTYRHDDRDTCTLSDNQIEGMPFEDSAGNIWVSTNTALHRYDPFQDCFHSFVPENAHAQGAALGFQSLFFDEPENRLWVYDRGTISHFYPEDPTCLALVDTLGDLYGRGLQICANSTMTEHFLFVPKENGGQVRFYGQGGEHKRINYPKVRHADFRTETFFLENDNLLWIGAKIGLLRLNLSSEELEIFPVNGLPINAVSGIVPLSEDKLLVSTKENGIYIFDKQGKSFTGSMLALEAEKILPFPYPIDQMYLDEDKVLWINAPGKGIFYTSLIKRKFKAALQNRYGEPAESSYVGSVAEDADGRLWALTKDGVFVLGPDGEVLPGFEKYHGANSILSGHDPYKISFDKFQRAWVCSHGGLFCLPKIGEDFVQMAVPNVVNKKRPMFTHACQLKDGRLLITTLKAGVFEVGGAKRNPALKKVTGFGADGSGYFSVFEGENQLYFSQAWTSLVICHQQKGKIEIDTFIPLKPFVTAMKEDAGRSILWIGTEQGIYKLVGQSPRFELVRDTIFPFQSVNGILLDDAGTLWVSTNEGLIQYAPDGPNPVWRKFSIEDGLQALQFNFSSALKTSYGKFVFGGVNGLNIFDPLEVASLHTPARPVITGIWVNDGDALPQGSIRSEHQAFPFIDHIRLAYRHNTVTIRFAALEYSDPKSTRFRYFLGESGNGTPGAPTDRNDVTYFDLREGTYQFHLEASNSDGIWSKETTILTITIRPPLHRSTLAYILYVLFVIGAVSLFVRFRIARIKKEAAFKQQMAETETAILRLQMNPHFIFNSMNSINSYILQKDIGTASDYLGRFAKLMRMILNLAAKPYISVFEEKELLEQYMDTEAMRFEEKFTYQVEVDEALDMDDTILPTMILQPFVENAIWHGLSGKGGDGLIKVSFLQENGRLVCSVEDNGIGRKAAAMKNRNRKHVSKALTITAERLALLKEEAGHVATCEIFDLEDAAGGATGTRVVLNLPML